MEDVMNNSDLATYLEEELVNNQIIDKNKLTFNIYNDFIRLQYGMFRYDFVWESGIFMMLITTPEGIEGLKYIRPIINEFMQCEPTLSYDLITDGYVFPITEWHLIYAYKRIKAIVNKEVSFDYCNLDLCGEKRNRYYRKNKHIFGIYPGTLKDKAKDINSYNEQQVYFLIRNAQEDLSKKLKKYGQNLSKLDILEEQFAYNYAIYQSKRFGVQFLEPELGNYIRSNNTFREWYNWWDNYFRNLDFHDLISFSKKVNNNEDVSMYVPEGNWQKTKYIN